MAKTLPFLLFLLPPLLLLLLVSCVYGFTSSSKTYIICMEKASMPSVFTTHAAWYQASVSAVKTQKRSNTNTNHNTNTITTTTSAASADSSANTVDDIIHIYDTVFHGFSVMLTQNEAAAIRLAPGFIAMFPDQPRHLHTTRTPAFLGLQSSSGLWPMSNYGSDVIIGLLDTGIWPGRESFNEHRIGPIPSRWKGECVAGGGFNTSLCNRKLIGARYFVKGYEAMSGPLNETVEHRSPLDTDGHGTHTASTAAGRIAYSANLMGQAIGTARGIAPKARIAAYKVCWASGCFDSDILAAFDQAVLDGVDIISLSVGGSVVPYYLDSIAIGTFAAMERGIFVSASGGNEGPSDMSVSNVAPWIATVGASTLDRDFPADIALGNNHIVKGVSLYHGLGLGPQMVPLVYAGDANYAKNGVDAYSSSLCLDSSLDPGLVKGKIVLCDRGNNPRVAKGEVVRKAGGAGMILANSAVDGEGLIADAHVLPAALVGSDEGDLIRSYVTANKDPVANIVFRGTVVDVKPAPVLAAFSARGPNPQTPQILKPDLIAPGVDILAAWTGALGPSGLTTDRREVKFNIISGTSMACPHVSGLAALLKSVHPDWSPAAIKSAMMTTAYIVDNRKQGIQDEFTGNASTPFGFGAGHINALKAMEPGLIYDIAPQDYIDFLCSLNYTNKAVSVMARRRVACSSNPRSKPGNLNYPAMSFVFDMAGVTPGMLVRETLVRTVTNVGQAKSTYKAEVYAPPGVTVSVNPKVLRFERVNEKKSFSLTVRSHGASLLPGEMSAAFGRLTWTNGYHFVRSPIAIIRQMSY